MLAQRFALGIYLAILLGFANQAYSDAGKGARGHHVTVLVEGKQIAVESNDTIDLQMVQIALLKRGFKLHNKNFEFRISDTLYYNPDLKKGWIIVRNDINNNGDSRYMSVYFFRDGARIYVDRTNQ